ncbi:MAG: sensor [Nitrospirales bacterium]|nr:MAG: sensor [Nitrospirales bacterium]
MREDRQSASRASVCEQALAWIIRQQSGEVKPEERRAFELWLHESPMHQREYERALEMWEKLDHIPPFLEAELADADQYWDRSVRKAGAGGTWGIWGWRPAFVAMSVAVVISGFLVWGWPGVMVHHETDQTAGVSVHYEAYQTAKGEQRQVTLPDGSTMLMNTDSQVSVQMSDDARIVYLEEGEALFTVAHDPQRPFDVHAANGIIHDIGTEFLVRRFSEKVHVAVLEGRVAVEVNTSPSTVSAIIPQPLLEGEEVFFTTEGKLSAVQPFKAQTAIAWRQGQLVFVETPLKDVLDEWARYQSDVIRLRDPNLGRMPVSGVFRFDNPTGFFRALGDILSLHPVRQGPNLIVLERQAKT